jgi:hypothetical protein
MPKKSRGGRPVAWYTRTIGTSARSWVKADQSLRNDQNRVLAQRAAEALTARWEHAFAWFWKLPPMAWDDMAEVLRHRRHMLEQEAIEPGQARMRTSALTALGRAQKPETIRIIARAVAKQYPLTMSTRTAARAITQNITKALDAAKKKRRESLKKHLKRK